MPLLERVGRNVRAYRISRGLTQADLAKRMGKRACGGNQVGAHERGLRSISVTTLEAYAQALDVEVEQLVREPDAAPAFLSRVGDAESNRFAAMYAGGYTLYDISERTGFSVATVQRHLKKRGVKMRTASDRRGRPLTKTRGSAA